MRFTWREDSLRVVGPHVRWNEPSAVLHLGNSGTSMRLLLAFLATGTGKFVLDGTPRLRERPIGPVLTALAEQGVGVRCLGEQGFGSAFPALVRAVEGLPGARLLVKPHPAEPAAPYEAVLRDTGATSARVLPPSSDLLELLCACDLLVTVESLAAVEALALGRPVVVLNVPTNLADLVEAGAALGVPEGQHPGPALAAALSDPATRQPLSAARDAYVTAVAGGLDGQATARIVALLRATALPQLHPRRDPPARAC